MWRNQLLAEVMKGRGHADVNILKSKKSQWPIKESKVAAALKAQYTLEVHARYTLSYCFPITAVVGVHSFKVFVIVSWGVLNFPKDSHKNSPLCCEWVSWSSFVEWTASAVPPWIEKLLSSSASKILNFESNSRPTSFLLSRHQWLGSWRNANYQVRT